MKECVRYAPMIGARQGELTSAEDAALRAHLEACPACRALAADFAATEGMVSEALLAAANRRDFGPFVDQVMARVEKEGARTGVATLPESAHAERSGSGVVTLPESAHAERSGRAAAAQSRHPRAHPPGFLAWLAAHRRAAFASLAPVLAAAALVVYVRMDDGRSHVASLELASEGEVTMILQTLDGPVVLLSGEES